MKKESKKKVDERKDDNKKVNEEKDDNIIVNEEKGNKKKVIKIVVIIVIGLIVVITGYLLTKFQNVTIELGTKEIPIEKFIKYGMNKGVSVDLSEVNFKEVGEYNVPLKYLFIKYNKNVNIVDTTPPKLETQNLFESLNYEIDVNDFIVDVSDESEYELSYEGNYDNTNYGEYKIKVIAKDKYNNKTVKENTIFISWVKKEYSIEMGNTLKREDLVHDKKDIDTIKQSDIDNINNSNEGMYSLKSIKNDMEVEAKIEKTKDVTPPELILKNVSIYKGRKVNGVNDFVSKAKDKVSKVTLKLLTEINYNKLGEQKVSIEASDENGNKVTKETTLKIVEDKDGPKISGVSKLTVNKNTKIDYRKGVSSYDANYGNCDFSVDSSGVDVTKHGTYYAIYTSSDKLGNKTTVKRTISVNHDQSDTNELVNKTASSLSSNAEAIRDYVRTIKYSTNNGGSDPTWYGLTNRSGNCIVHAYVFNALLKAKGYSSKIIWTTDKTHYWNMVYLNGKWVHMDSTPTSRHNKISIMNDDQRYANLQGRDWDRSAWPQAE